MFYVGYLIYCLVGVHGVSTWRTCSRFGPLYRTFWAWLPVTTTWRVCLYWYFESIFIFGQLRDLYFVLIQKEKDCCHRECYSVRDSYSERLELVRNYVLQKQFWKIAFYFYVNQTDYIKLCIHKCFFYLIYFIIYILYCQINSKFLFEKTIS